MKKIIFVLLGFSILSVVGCQKKAQTPPASSESEVGVTTTTSTDTPIEPNSAEEASAPETAAEPTPAA